MSIFKPTPHIVDKQEERQLEEEHQLEEERQLEEECRLEEERRLEEIDRMRSTIQKQQLALAQCQQEKVELEEKNIILHTMIQQQQTLITQKFTD